MLCIYQDIVKFSSCRGFSLRLQNFIVLYFMHVFHCLMLWLVSKRMLTTFLHISILIFVSIDHLLNRNITITSLYITILYIAISTSSSCTSQSYTIIFFITICKSSNFTLQSLHTVFFITQSLHHHLLHHSFYVRIFFTVVVLFNSSL